VIRPPLYPSYLVNRNLRLCLGLILSAVGANTSGADTIQPTTGPDASGTVVKYANNTFEVRAADGKMRNFSANSIKRIAFDNQAAPIKVISRTKGPLEGSISAYENGAFNFTSPAGVEKLSAIFVDRVTFGVERGQAIDIITKGRQVDVSKHLAPGLVTIIDFYADWCGPCKQISPVLEQMARTDPDIALRKIDIINWESPVAKQYKVQSIPRIEVYNRAGNLVGTAGASAEQVRRFVAQAKL